MGFLALFRKKGGQKGLTSAAEGYGEDGGKDRPITESLKADDIVVDAASSCRQSPGTDRAESYNAINL